MNKRTVKRFFNNDATLRRGIMVYHRMGRLTTSQITGGKP